MRYTEVTRTEAGGSAFAEATLPLTVGQVAPGVPAMAVAALPSRAGVQFLRSDAFDSEPHPAPREQWVVMLRGTIEVTVTDGSRRRFGPGDLVLVTDTTGTGHTTTAVGDSPLEALFIPV
ncbi:MAG: cupin domain-containing protein [Nonomuraea sp.]|nr:cupin domain-containing protein [Nonomuraea sp.]